jgi:DNA-binding XRE family transcriptional regulator
VRKHGVGFDEAASAFFDAAHLVLEDPKYDGRLWLIGFSHGARLLLVVHVALAYACASSAPERRRDMKRSSTVRAEPRRALPLAEDDGLDVDVTKLRVVGRGIYANKRIGLGALRAAKGVTQVEMASRMGITQTQVSKIEAGEDHLVSTLRRYAEALAGAVEVSIVVDGRRYLVG